MMTDSPPSRALPVADRWTLPQYVYILSKVVLQYRNGEHLAVLQRKYPMRLKNKLRKTQIFWTKILKIKKGIRCDDTV